MKKEYLSPEFGLKKLNLVMDILADSHDEKPSSGENEPDPLNPFPDGPTPDF